MQYQTTKYITFVMAGMAVGFSSTAACARDDAGADSEIVVVAVLLHACRDESGQAISIISSDLIDRSQSTDVAGLLASAIPSVRFNVTGSAGGVTGVSLRGAETTQTLVLIDGVRINDPATIGNQVDFGNLLTANIRRIEVLRGSNAVAFGADAIGGIVNLSTGEALADGVSGRVSAEYGYAETRKAKASVAYAGEGLRASLGYAYVRTDGISSVAPQFGGTEADGLQNHTANARVELDLADNVRFDLRGYYIHALLQTDSFFGGPTDSTDVSDSHQYVGYAGLSADFADGMIRNRLAFTYLAADRDYFFAPSPSPDYGYRGKSWRIEYRGEVRVADPVRLVVGFDHDAPEYRFFGFGSDDRFRSDTDSLFGLVTVKPAERLSLTAGVRRDWHSQFGGVTTFGANANWGLANGTTRLRASFGQGFKAPSLYQLYDSFVGNAGLTPERSDSVDAGIDQTLLDGRLTVSATVFHRLTRNQIDFDNARSTYNNLARTRATGVELTADLKLSDGLEVHAAYSHIDTRDRSPGSVRFNRHLQRRALDSGSVAVDKSWDNGFSAGLTAQFVGASLDRTAITGRIGGYALLGVRAQVKLTDALTLYGRIDNLFDRTYATAYGYGTYGRSAFAGVKAAF